MVKLYLLGIVGMIAVMVFTGSSVTTSTAAPDPEEVARQGMERWLDSLRLDTTYEDFGFLDEAELDRAVLDKPYPVARLTPEAIESYTVEQSIKDLLEYEAWWEFPVLVDGEARGLLTVAEMEGTWQVVSFGGLKLSQRVLDMQQQVTDTLADVTLVKVFPIHGTFAFIERDGVEELVHLSSYPGLIDTAGQEQRKSSAPADMVSEIDDAIDVVIAAEEAVTEDIEP